MSAAQNPLRIYQYCLTMPREIAHGIKVGDAMEIHAPLAPFRQTMVVAAKKGKQSLTRVYLRPML